MSSRRAALVTALAILVYAAPAAAALVTLTALERVVHVDDVQISRDGSAVAFVRSIGDYQHDRWSRALVVMPSAGGVPHVLAANTDELKSPRWSPLGTSVAYLANDPKKIQQLYSVPVAGGPVRQITHTDRDVEQFAWSPDGTRIAYVTEDGPADPAAAARHDDLWAVHDDGFLSVHAPAPSHIWLVRAIGGKPQRLTHGSWSVLEADPSFAGVVTDPSWSADGTTITFTQQANADDSDSDRTSIAKVDVATGAVTKIDGRTRYEYQPAFAPYGAQLAFLFPHGKGPISVLDLWVAGYGRVGDLTAQFDHDITWLSWMPGNRIAMLAPEGAHAGLFALQLPLGTVSRIPLGALEPAQISVAANGKIALIASTTNQPPEVYVLDAIGAAPRALTHLNAALTSTLTFGRSTELAWTAPDGEHSDGILTYPAGYQTGTKYPLVLRIHGGPEERSDLAWFDLRQLYAARGYVVFEPNYRGSDNLGTAHEHAIFGDPGAGPAGDVMAGVAAVEQLGIVDTAREAVSGHSYGGYMTAWLIGHDHRWRAAVIGDGLFDWTPSYALSATGNLAWVRDSLGGTPWSSPALEQLYHDGSPITYVHAITTPTRLITGTSDEQAPLIESYVFYHALHDLGTPTSLIAIPGAKHFPEDPVHIEGYDRVTLEWLDHYLSAAP